MGTTNELAELQRALRDDILDYPHTAWIEGVDPTRHVALLSRFPIVEQRSRTNDTYQLDGHAMRVSRGILDVRIQVSPTYSFRAIVVHLKSKRQTDEGDQAVMRREEARLVRRHVEQILQRDPNENVVVMGDFNDSTNSEAIQTITGTNSHRLFALHPRDRKGYDTTHFWKAKREFSRLDYLILSPGMSNEFITGTAQIVDPPRWLDASDHRPVAASFHIGDLGNARPAR
jgi:endonuclease/exonuclease/phosphatase family metal-dependent hydrolase